MDDDTTAPNELSEEELWSLVDRDAPELDAWLETHPERAAEVAELRRTLRALRPAPEAPRQVGPYELGKRLGEGGMGVVYSAIQPSTQRTVAVKLLRNAQLAGDRERLRFAREIQALGRLHHPGIAAIHDAGVSEDGVSYYAMEYVDGPNLIDYARSHRLPLRDRLNLIVRVCRAVQHAHERGVVHRDLKPSNILVDAEGGTRVLDFGLARLGSAPGSLSTQSTRSGSILGSVPYMSPEQAGGETSDERSDVYSLGVLLYELITDQRPIPLVDVDLVEAVRRIQNRTPARPSKLNRGLSRTLDVVTLKALSKSAGDRYPSAAALADDIERFQRGEPVLATRPSRLRRAVLFVRRNLGLVSLGAIVAVLLAAIGVQTLLTHPALRGITGDGFPERTPFDAVRWTAKSPLVRVNGEWLELISIDKIPAEDVVDYCVRYSNRGRYGWKRRFEQDMWQVLMRMGHFPGFRLDLELLDAETGLPVILDDVWMTDEKRRASWQRAQRWKTLPFSDVAWDGDSPVVEVNGEWFRLLGVAGIPIDRVVFYCQVTDPDWKQLFRSDFVHVLGDIQIEPEARVFLELESIETGEREERSVELLADNWKTASEESHSSPFESIAWDHQIPLVRHDGKWQRLASVDGVPIDKLLRRARRLFESPETQFELNFFRLLPESLGRTEVELGISPIEGGAPVPVRAQVTEENWMRSLLRER